MLKFDIFRNPGLFVIYVIEKKLKKSLYNPELKGL